MSDIKPIIYIDKDLFDIQLISVYDYGLVVGQYESESVHYSVLLCKSPEKDLNNGCVTDSKKFVSRIDEEWISKHAENVLRSCPGGLEIIGIFACVQTELFDDLSTKLKSCLVKIYKQVGAFKVTKEATCSRKSIFLIHPDTYNITAYSTDAANPLAGVLKATVHTGQSFVSRWIPLSSKFHITATSVLSSQCVANNNLLAQLQEAVNPCVQKALDSQAFVHGDQLDLDRKLVDILSSKLNNDDTVYLEFIDLSGANDAHSKENSVLVDDASGRKLEMIGLMPVFGLVHPKALGLEADQALKDDLVRSLDARLDLIVQELSISSGIVPSTDVGPRNPPPLIKLPRRVLARHPRCPKLVMTDYSFPGETVNDVQERLHYFLGINFAVNDLDFITEMDNQSNHSSPEELSADEAEEIIQGVDRVVNRKIPLYYFLALVVLFIAVLCSVLAYKS